MRAEACRRPVVACHHALLHRADTPGLSGGGRTSLVSVRRCTRFGASLHCPRARDRRRLDDVKPLERISIDPAVRFGKPCVRGTRITVGDVLGYLAGGTPEDELLAEFPQLSAGDVRACLVYAAERERRTTGAPAA